MEPAEIKQPKPLAKLITELGPLLLFFFTNARGNQLIEAYPSLGIFGDEPIFLATAVFMAAMLVSLVYSKLTMGKLPVMPLVTGVVVLIFGGLTLWLQNDTFIKMKPTIVNGLFGIVLVGGMVYGKSLLSYVFGEVFKLDEPGWKKLTWRWAAFFFFLAIVNEIVWRNFSTDFWVAFKVWGIMPITMVFTLAQMPLIMKHSTEPLPGMEGD